MIDKRNLKKGIIFSVLLITACVFAIPEQDIQKIRQAMPDKPVIQPAKSRTMLVFSLCKGFKHGSIPHWMKALDIMGEKTGAFSTVHSTDMSIFSPEQLKKFDVICLNNTTGLVPDKAQQQAIMNFIKSGKGIIGIHAATDNFYKWPEGMKMMGGSFTGHPWTAGGTWAIKLDDPDHPLMKSFGGRNFKIKDEIYRTQTPPYSRKNQRVLMSLDMSDSVTKNAKGVREDDMDTGISWVKSVGRGRLFYCSLGHNNHLTWNTPVLEHYLAGIQYAAGDLKADDAPLGERAPELNVSKLEGLVGQVARNDWASNRADAVELEKLIGTYYKDADTLGQIEDKLLAALQSNVTMAGRDFICRQLAVIGTNKSVPVLSAMLMDPETSNLARYALEKIPGKSVDEALMSAALKTKDKEILIGIITTLGVRKSESVVSLSRQKLTGVAVADPAVSTALVQSLGYVGTETAAAELTRIKSQITGTVLKRWPDAMLMCADAMQQAGQKKPAIAIYQKLYKTEPSSIIRASALNALVDLDADGAEKLVKQAIGGKDAIIQSSAIQSLVFMKDNTSYLKAIASSAADLPTDAQIQLVTVMPEVSKEIARSLAVDLLNSQHESVRIAAYQAIERAGDKFVVEILVSGAAEAQSRPERQAAQEALYRLAGKEVDAMILQVIAAFKTSPLDEKAIIGLIKATVNRQISEAPEVLLRTAGSDNRKISAESIKALQSLAGPEYMEELVDLLISRPGNSTQNILVTVAEKIPDRNRRAELILDKYASTRELQARVSMLRVLGKIGDPHAVSLLKKERASSDSTIGQAAFRAMADWPGDDFKAEMKKLAQSNDDEKTKILALRAYIQMLNKSADKKSVDELIAAYAMAERADEQKIVIAALGDHGSLKAMNFVKSKLSDPTLKAEAQVCLIQICEKLVNRNPSGIKPILQALKNCDNETVKAKAAELLGSLPNLGKMMLDWKISGPHKVSGKVNEALFNHAFPIEKDASQGKWQNPQKFLNKNTGIFNLNQLGSGDNLVVYFKTTILTEKAIPAIFGIGSDDGVKVWLNGKSVHANYASRPVKKDQDKVNVKLNKGPNQVLVKVVQLSGNWGFCMSVADSDGNEIPGLQVNAED